MAERKNATETPLLALPFLAAGQAQKHVTLNETLLRLDAIVQIGVESRHQTQPPLTPTPGARFLVPEAAINAWAGHAGHIAAWQDEGWVFYSPLTGWLVFVADEGLLLAYTGAGWAPALGGVQTLPALGIGTSADAGNPLAVRGDATLLTHDESGSHQLKLNKAAPGHTASLLFQTQWSGRAEIGLAGNDALSVKVSADGVNWNIGLAVQGDGRVAIGAVSEARAVLHVGGAMVLGSISRTGLPDPAAIGPGGLAYVPDAPGGGVLAVCDGANWRRVADRTVIS